MSLLIVSDILQVIVELGGEAGIGESLLVPFAESLLVESILEVFECECVLQDDGVDVTTVLSLGGCSGNTRDDGG